MFDNESSRITWVSLSRVSHLSTYSCHFILIIKSKSEFNFCLPQEHTYAQCSNSYRLKVNEVPFSTVEGFILGRNSNARA